MATLHSNIQTVKFQIDELFFIHCINFPVHLPTFETVICLLITAIILENLQDFSKYCFCPIKLLKMWNQWNIAIEKIHTVHWYYSILLIAMLSWGIRDIQKQALNWDPIRQICDFFQFAFRHNPTTKFWNSTQNVNFLIYSTQINKTLVLAAQNNFCRLQVHSKTRRCKKQLYIGKFLCLPASQLNKKFSQT